MKKLNLDEIFGLVFIAFILAVIFSWVPWLGYILAASVFPLPVIEWEQATFFTWVGLTLVFWYKS